MGTAQAQAQLWGRHPLTWSQTMEQQMRPLYLATLDALAPLDGASVLDAGCGSGQALADAASRGATVTGVRAARTAPRRRSLRPPADGGACAAPACERTPASSKIC